MTNVRQWSILTGLAVVGILLAGWFLVVSPKRGEAADLRAETTTQEQRNAQLRTQLAMLKAQAKKLPAQQARLAEIAAKLPDNPALPALVRSLTDAADESGVDIVSMAPGQPAAVSTGNAGAGTGSPSAAPTPSAGSGSAGSGSTGSGSGGGAKVGQLASLPVTLQVHGGYFQLEQFLHRLETMQRAYLVQGISLAPGEKLAPENASSAAGEAGTDNLVATLTGRVFLVANRPAATPAPSSAPAAK